MYKSMLFLAVLCVFSFSQTTIPMPTSNPNAIVEAAVNIGDFDGDSSDDLYVQLYDNSTVGCYLFGIYSKKKNQYLVLVPACGAPGKPDAVGNFDGDKSLEIVVRGIIYKYNSTLTKKKI